jgi:hypothetical protein
MRWVFVLCATAAGTTFECFVHFEKLVLDQTQIATAFESSSFGRRICLLSQHTHDSFCRERGATNVSFLCVQKIFRRWTVSYNRVFLRFSWINLMKCEQILYSDPKKRAWNIKHFLTWSETVEQNSCLELDGTHTNVFAPKSRMFRFFLYDIRSTLKLPEQSFHAQSIGWRVLSI